MLVRKIVAAGEIVQLSLLLGAGLFFVACQQKAQGAHGDDPAGMYTLISVDGSKLPATVSHGGVAIRVRSGTFMINADGTCTSKVTFGPPSGDEFTREVNATYTQKGAKLTMQWKGAGQTIGNVEGDGFTMNNEGMLFVYQKQASPEMEEMQEVLDRFLGTWRSVHTHVPVDETTVPVDETTATDLSYRRVLDGRFVQEQGRVSGENTALVMYTYDADRDCYRMWHFSSDHRPSDATGKWDPKTKTLTWTSVAEAGQDFTMTSRHHFLNENEFDWDVVGKDRTGKMTFRVEGKATRTGELTQ